MMPRVVCTSEDRLLTLIYHTNVCLHKVLLSLAILYSMNV